MKKNNRLLQTAVFVGVVLAHMGIGAWAWKTTNHIPETVDADNLTFVDLGTLDGGNQPAAEEAPAPIETKTPPPEPKPKPEPKKAEPKSEPKPKIQAVVRNDVPADFKQPEKTKSEPKPKPDPKPVEPEKTKPEVERKLEPIKQTPTNHPSNPSTDENNPNALHRTENRSREDGNNPNSKTPGNNSGDKKDGDEKGKKGDGDSNNKKRSHDSNIADGGYKQLPMPTYPRSARDNEEEGIVKLMVIVEPNGTVSSITVTQSSGFVSLDNAAKLTAQKARYQPKTRDGEPIRTRFTTSFTFKLD